MRSSFSTTIPFTQVLSTTKQLGNACGDAVGVLQSREKEKKVLIALANSMKLKLCGPWLETYPGISMFVLYFL